MNAFIIALSELREEWLESLPAPEYVPQYEHSAQYLRWEQRVVYGRGSALRNTAKVILIAAVLIIMLAVIAISTNKGREFVLKYFKTAAQYSTVATDSREVRSLEVGSIPAGFELKEEVNEPSINMRYYVYHDDWFEVQKKQGNTTTNFNIEDRSLETITQNNIEYILLRRDGGISAVIWNCNDYQYYLCGTLSLQKLLGIAESVN